VILYISVHSAGSTYFLFPARLHTENLIQIFSTMKNLKFSLQCLLLNELSIVIISVYKNSTHGHSGIWVGYKPTVLRDAKCYLVIMLW